MTYTFPERLKELRAEKRLTTRQLAKEIGCSNIAISRWERGTQIPGIDKLMALAIFFNVSTDYLVGFED